MNASSVLAIFILAVAALTASGDTLSISDVRRIALEKSVQLKQAELSVHTRLLDADIAGADFLPELSAQANLGTAYPSSMPRHDDALDWSSGWGISLSQKIFSGGSRLAAMKQTGLAVRQAEADLLSARLAVLKEADSRYLDVLEKTQLVKAADLDFAASRLHLDVADAKRAAGLIDGATFLKTKSDFTAKQAASQQAAYDLFLSRLKLASLLGSSREIEVGPMDDGEANIRLMRGISYDKLECFSAAMIEAGRLSSPDVRKKELAVDLAGAAAQARIAPFLPSVSLGWSQSWAQTEYSALADGGRLTLTGSIPLFPWQGRLADLRKAETSRQSSVLTLADGLEQYALSLKGIVLDLVASANRMESARVALEYSQEHYNQVFEKFKLSAATNADLSDAEALLSASRSQVISSRFAYYRAWTSLLYGIGREDEAELLEIISRAGYGGEK